VRLPDGRRVLLREYGDAQGMPIIALHGTPASRLMYAAAQSAGAFGQRIIAPDRWGYGGTSPHPRPSLSAFADDMAHIADVLQLDRFAVLAVSGGGPYASAMGALLGARVTALALVSPVGPIAKATPSAYLTPFHKLCFRILPRAPAVMRGVFAAFRGGLARAPEATMRIAFVRAPAPDRRILEQGVVQERFKAMFAEGLRPGVEGALIDMQMFSTPWNLPLQQTKAPSRLWIGTADNNVPLAAAKGLAQAVPACELIELPGAGHLWIAENYDQVLAWIAEKQKGAATTAPSH